MIQTPSQFIAAYADGIPVGLHADLCAVLVPVTVAGSNEPRLDLRTGIGGIPLPCYESITIANGDCLDADEAGWKTLLHGAEANLRKLADAIRDYRNGKKQAEFIGQFGLADVDD